MLTRKVAEELDEQNYFPCYFFFKGGDNHQDRAAPAICAMLHQLFCRHRELLVKQCIERNGSR